MAQEAPDVVAFMESICEPGPHAGPSVESPALSMQAVVRSELSTFAKDAMRNELDVLAQRLRLNLSEDIRIQLELAARHSTASPKTLEVPGVPDKPPLQGNSSFSKCAIGKGAVPLKEKSDIKETFLTPGTRTLAPSGGCTTIGPLDDECSNASATEFAAVGVTGKPLSAPSNCQSTAWEPNKRGFSAGKRTGSAHTRQSHQFFGQGSGAVAHFTIDKEKSELIKSRWSLQRAFAEFLKIAQEMPSAFALRRYAMALVTFHQFDYISGFFIVLNAISIGVQTDYLAKNSEDLAPRGMQVLDSVFCIIFTMELFIRIIAAGRRFFGTRSEHRWNMFDMLMVSMQLSDEIARELVGYSSGEARNMSFFRVLRVLRLVRIIRLVRVLHLVRELRALVWSVSNSLQSLGWTVLLILFMIYLVGVFFTQLVADHWKDLMEEGRTADKNDLQLKDLLGNLPRTCLSLFQSITNGVDWNDLVSPLSESISPFAGFCFAIYISFAVLAMLNVVTGVFVDSALQCTAKDRDANLVGRLKELFKRGDKDGSGAITVEEFDGLCEDPGIELQFRAIDMDIMEARSLFFLLDIDDDGAIAKEEFIQGCLRLRGSAQAIDLATMMFESKRNHRLISETMARLCVEVRSFRMMADRPSCIGNGCDNVTEPRLSDRN